MTKIVNTSLPSAYSYESPRNEGIAAPDKELRDKVTYQVKQLQQLWKDYEHTPTPQLKGTISQGVTALQHLVSQCSRGALMDQQLQEAQDYLMACSLYLAERPKGSAANDCALTPHRAIPVATTGPASHRERVLQAIAKDFTIVDAGAAGNCCIHAALFSGNPEWNSNTMVDMIRGDVVAVMRATLRQEVDQQWGQAKQYQTPFLPFIVTDHGGSQREARRQVDAYCNRMAKRGTWFGEPELPFLAQTLRRDIVVYDAAKMTCDSSGKLRINDSMMRYSGGPNSSGQIEILHDGNHYLALLPNQK